MLFRSFLGLDMNHWDNGPPSLFETMLFVNGVAEDWERCSTWAEAEQSHANMLAKVFKATPILALPDKAK